MPEELSGGRFAAPTRRGRQVIRRPQQDNRTVRLLLEHFASVGCELTPRFLGVEPDGAERLSFIDGVTGYPPLSAELRSDEALVSVARAIRTVHDASVGFVPPADARWHGYDLVQPTVIDCIGHGDLAPWNIVFEGTEVRGIIDWDAARPSSRVWDLGYAAHQFVPFHPAASMPASGWQTEPDRADRLRIFVEAYGLGVEAADLVDAAALRLLSIGGFLDRRARAGDPAYEVQTRERHANGYRRAAANLIMMRDSLLG